MRLIHPRLAEWLRNDPIAASEFMPDDQFTARRKAELRPVFDANGKLLEYRLRLIGGGADGMRHTTLALIQEQCGGPSGGGSAPDTIEVAVNAWLQQAGYPDEVKGGAR